MRQEACLDIIQLHVYRHVALSSARLTLILRRYHILTNMTFGAAHLFRPTPGHKEFGWRSLGAAWLPILEHMLFSIMSFTKFQVPQDREQRIRTLYDEHWIISPDSRAFLSLVDW